MDDPINKINPIRAGYFEDIVATIREPLVVLDAAQRILSANRSFYKFFKVKHKETIGSLLYDLGNRQWDIPALRGLLETILTGKASFNDFEVEHEFTGIGRRILLLNARRIPSPPKEAQLILLAFEDITQRRKVEQTLQVSEERFRRSFETAQDGILLVEKTSGKIANSNAIAQELLGYPRSTLLKKNLWSIGIFNDEEMFRQTALELEEKGFVGFTNQMIPTRRGGNFFADVYFNGPGRCDPMQYSRYARAQAGGRDPSCERRAFPRIDRT